MDVFRMDDDDHPGDGGGADGLEYGPEPEDEGEARGLGALVARHPLATLGGALATGYLLGGGLATAVGRRVLRVGVRLGFQLALLPELERDVVNLASRLGQALRTVADATAPPHRTNGPNRPAEDS